MKGAREKKTRKIGDLVGRVLSGKPAGPPGDKDYQALWEKVVPRALRQGVFFRSGAGGIVLAVENPAARHRLEMYREKLLAEYRKNGMAVKKITIVTPD